jgi:hypothetical protein
MGAEIPHIIRTGRSSRRDRELWRISNFSASIGEQAAPSEIPKNERQLQRLVEAYRTQEIIVGGVTEDAREENRKVFMALQDASREIDPNHIFGIHLLGSRIKGYNKVGSDVDFIAVEVRNNDNIVGVVNRSLSRAGLSVDANRDVEALLDTEELRAVIPTEATDFLQQVRRDPYRFQKLFGTETIATPNLYLAQLSFFESLQFLDRQDHWSVIQGVYDSAFLGSSWHDLGKFTRRLGVPSLFAEQYLTKELFQERYARFGLRSFAEEHARLESWMEEQDQRALESYCMYPVLQGIQRKK